VITTYEVRIENESSDDGRCWVWIYDEKGEMLRYSPSLFNETLAEQIYRVFEAMLLEQE